MSDDTKTIDLNETTAPEEASVPDATADNGQASQSVNLGDIGAVADPFALPTEQTSSDAPASTDAATESSPSAPSDAPSDAPADAPAPEAPTDAPAPEAPVADEPPAIEPPPVDNTAVAIEPPKAPEAEPSVPGDSASAAGTQDQAGSSGSTPSAAPSAGTDGPSGNGLEMPAHGDIDEYPKPTDAPAVHPQTGKPLDGDALLGGGEAEANKGSAQAGGATAAEPAAPAPAEAAPTAANVPDAYTKLTDDGAKLADALDELAKDAGAVLLLDLKAAANYAAHIVDTLQLVLEQGGRKKNKRQLEALLSVFQQVESTVEPLLEKDGSAQGQGSLEAGAADALSGIEELVLGMFSKLKGE